MEDKEYSEWTELPELAKYMETYYKPIMENRTNELLALLRPLVSEESQVRNEGIKLAIKRYGLQLNTEESEPVPSTSKKQKLEQDYDDIMMAAVGTAISAKGLDRH